MLLQAGRHSIDLTDPVVMGVLNVTPDSFSDGGRYFSTAAARRQAEIMISEGAAIIDVGGESTRPGADEVSVQQELDRVMPLVEFVCGELDACLSIDTSKPAVMTSALAAGAAMVNDVYALQLPGAIEALAPSDCAVCLMHMQGVPRSMQKSPAYENVSREVAAFLDDRITACVAGGIGRERIVVDPGFGFGKTDRHNLELLAKLGTLQCLERPVLVGLSRKRTLGNVTGQDVEGRLAAGIAAAIMAVERGASIIRTHDVGATVDALKIVTAVVHAAPAEPG